MRIAVGQLSQETNTFNPWPTTREAFSTGGIHRGADLLAAMAQTSEIGGFLQGLASWPEPVRPVGLARLFAWPGGRLTAATRAWIHDEFIAALATAGPVEGVLLSLHGALAAEDEPDVSGQLLVELRRRLGPRVPLVATLDLHANITPALVANASALVLFHTAPHIDVYETGVRAAAVLRRIVCQGARPVSALVKLPLVVPAERANTQDPASISYGLRERLQALEAEPGMLSAGLAPVQPWLDVPNLGTSVVVVTDGDALRATQECERLAGEVWRRRAEYLPELTSVEEAVRQAFELESGLTVISDSADATTSGAPGDSTWVLRELEKYAWPHPALVTLVAPEAVRQARELGVGQEWTPSLGGIRDHRHSQPFAVKVRVERLFEARFILSGHLGRNLPIDMGEAAVVSRDHLKIILTSGSGPHFAPDLFCLAGFDPFAAQVLVAKSPCGFRAAYAERAARIFVVRAPGCAPSDFWNYSYEQIARPLWPWDQLPEGDWPPITAQIFRGG